VTDDSKIAQGKMNHHLTAPAKTLLLLSKHSTKSSKNCDSLHLPTSKMIDKNNASCHTTTDEALSSTHLDIMDCMTIIGNCKLKKKKKHNLSVAAIPEDVQLVANDDCKEVASSDQKLTTTT